MTMYSRTLRTLLEQVERDPDIFPPDAHSVLMEALSLAPGIDTVNQIDRIRESLDRLEDYAAELNPRNEADPSDNAVRSLLEFHRAARILFDRLMGGDPNVPDPLRGVAPGVREIVLDALRVRAMDFVGDRLHSDGGDEAADLYRALVPGTDDDTAPPVFDPDHYHEGRHEEYVERDRLPDPAESPDPGQP